MIEPDTPFGSDGREISHLRVHRLSESESTFSEVIMVIPERLTGSIIIAFLALAAFLPAVRDGFVFDDVAQAERLIPARSFSGWLKSAADPWWPPHKLKYLWRPATRLVILAERAVTPARGDEIKAWPFHLSSVVLHAIASVLVLWLALSLGMGFGSAVFCAGFIAVHPLKSEAVHQIVGQAEILASIFMLAGLLHFIRSMKAKRPWIQIIPLQAIFYAIALGSKEHAVLYPIFPFLYFVSMRRSRKTDEQSQGPKADSSSRQMEFPGFILLLASLTLILILFLWGRYSVTGGLLEGRASVPEFENPLAQWDFARRAPATLGIFAYAVEKTFLPIRLCPDYSTESLPFDSGWNWPYSWAGAAILAVLAWGAIRSFVAGGRAWALILAGLAAYSITSNFFFAIGVSMAERLWYFPIIALGLGIGFLIDKYEPAKRISSRVLGFASAGLLLLLVSASWGYAPAWRSQMSFAEWTMRRFPNSWRGHFNLSREYYLQRDFEHGLEHARIAVELRPEDARSWDDLGLNANFIEGGQEEAERAYREALRLNPELDLVYQHLANLLMLEGRAADALPYYERYLQAAPEDERQGVVERIRMIRSRAESKP